jgi:putative inorganic carbon (hco3(-)) transporter
MSDLISSFQGIKADIKNWLKMRLFVEKLNNPLGYLVLALFAIGFGYLISNAGLGIGALTVGGIMGIPLIILCIFYPQFGIAALMGIAYMVQYISKFSDSPFGTVMDGLLVLMCFGILIGQILNRNWKFAKDPVSTWLIIWIYFNLIQGLNPAAESKLAWIYTVRSVALYYILYFVACYSFSSLDKIKFLLKWILGLTAFTMLYAFKQEFIGPSSAERAWLYADPERFQLFYQWGRLRIFSLFNDPMTFGVMMTYMGVFCFILATAPLKTWKVITLVVLGFAMLWTTAYTGTRTCYVLIPLGFIYFALMKLTPKVLIVSAIFMMFGAVFVLKSTNNPVIFRIQSAFKPSQDASVQIRYYNQQRVRPILYSHPIGSGLGSTGLWARRFTPDTFLAHFAHDSYYVRLAVETGWIGLILYMILLGTSIRRGIYYYLRVKDPTIKTLYLALVTSLFMLAVANYPQEAIDQLPTSLVTYIFMAAIVRLKDYDAGYLEGLARMNANKQTQLN